MACVAGRPKIRQPAPAATMSFCRAGRPCEVTARQASAARCVSTSIDSAPSASVFSSNASRTACQTTATRASESGPAPAQRSQRLLGQQQCVVVLQQHATEAVLDHIAGADARDAQDAVVVRRWTDQIDLRLALLGDDALTMLSVPRSSYRLGDVGGGRRDRLQPGR